MLGTFTGTFDGSAPNGKTYTISNFNYSIVNGPNTTGGTEVTNDGVILAFIESIGEDGVVKNLTIEADI